MSHIVIDLLEKYYPQQFENALLDEIAAVATVEELPAQEILMDVGLPIRSIPLVLSGAICIMRDEEQGAELLLYHLERGDTCAMTLSCCLGTQLSRIRAVTETEVKLLIIPVQYMDSWMAKYVSWRNFVLQSYHNRLDEMLSAIDSLAFMDMSDRVKQYLFQVASLNKGKVVAKTHQDISYALNTSRVVVSRILKKLEKEGFLRLSRNAITLL